MVGICERIDRAWFRERMRRCRRPDSQRMGWSHGVAIVPALVMALALTWMNFGAQQAHAQTCISGDGFTHQQVWWTGAGSTKFRIDFSSGEAVLIEDGHAQTPSFEGTAVYTNALGDLILYTDGQRVFDGQTHAELTDELPGSDSATEAAIIVPKPGTTDTFYVFGNSADTTNGTIGYVSVTMSDPPVVSSAETLVVGLTGEQLTSIPHSNGRDFWVVTIHNTSPITLAAYLITNTEVGETVALSPLGVSSSATTLAGRGTLSYHVPTGYLLIGNFGNGQGIIYGSAFDASSGLLTGPFAEFLSGDVGYSAVMSPNGEFVYITVGVQGFDGSAHVIDVATGVSENLDSAYNRWGGARLAPDGRIYYASYFHDRLLVVEDPNNGSTTTSEFLLGTRRSGYHLPTVSYPACADAGCRDDLDCGEDEICDLLLLRCRSTCDDDDACDDGNPCTRGSCLVDEGVCSIALQDAFEPCDDGYCDGNGSCRAQTELSITSPPDGALLNDPSPEIAGAALPDSEVDVALVASADLDSADYIYIAATIDDLGRWTLETDDELDDDEYLIVARAVSTTGDRAVATSTFTIDTRVDYAIDQIDANGVAGTGEPGTTIFATMDGDEIGQTIVGEDGTWQIDFDTPLEDGAAVELTFLDPAGNIATEVVHITTTGTDPDPSDAGGSDAGGGDTGGGDTGGSDTGGGDTGGSDTGGGDTGGSDAGSDTSDPADVGDADDDTPSEDEVVFVDDSGCGCASTSGGASSVAWIALGLFAVATRRRREGALGAEAPR